MKKLVFLLCLFVFSSHLKAQWSYQYSFDTYVTGIPMPYGTFYDASFISKDTGMYSFTYTISASSGDGSQSKRTTDGGNTWTFNDGGPGSGFRYYTIPAKKTFFIVENNSGGPSGAYTTIKRSTDGGSPSSTLYHAGYSLTNGFSSPDTNCFYFIRFQLPPPSVQFYLGRYKNGIINGSVLNISSYSPGSLSFPDTAIGYMSGASGGLHYIFKTYNSGNSWDTLLSDPTRTFGPMQFLSKDTGFVLSGSEVAKTSDGGISWTFLNTGFTGLSSMFFIDADTGYVAGNNGVIGKTTDGGTSWIAETTGTTDNFNKIFFVNEGHVGYALAGKNLYMRGGTTSIASHTVLSEFIASPNPSGGISFISLPGVFNNTVISVSIYDMMGRCIRSTQEMGNRRLRLDLSLFTKGTYIVRVSSENQSAFGKIIVE